LRGNDCLRGGNIRGEATFMRWQCLRADQRVTCGGGCCSLSTAPSSGPVWVRTGFTIFGPPPNPEPDFGFGSAPTPNFELDLSLVRKSSGSNLGSELDCSNTRMNGVMQVAQSCHCCPPPFLPQHCLVLLWLQLNSGSSQEPTLANMLAKPSHIWL